MFQKHLPLSNIRIMLTGTDRIIRQLTSTLMPLGAIPIELSLLSTVALTCPRIDDAVSDCSWLVFTSTFGIDCFFRQINIQQLSPQILAKKKFAAVGVKCATALKAHGYEPDYIPSEYSGKALAENWVPLLTPVDKVVLFRAKQATTVLPEALKTYDIDYLDIPIYETRIKLTEQVRFHRLLPDIDYIVAASSSAAQAFAALNANPQMLNDKIISIGRETETTLKQLGFSVLATAIPSTTEGITKALLDCCTSRQKNSNLQYPTTL